MASRRRRQRPGSSRAGRNPRLWSTRAVLAVLLVAAVVSNLAQFNLIERRLPHHWRAVTAYASGDLTDIGLDLGEPENVRERFGLSLSLGEVAPGVVLIVPDWVELHGMLSVELLLGLADVAHIERRAYDPDTVAADIDVEQYVVREGPGGEREAPYAIAVGDDPTTLVLLRRDHAAIVLVDTALLSTARLEELGP